MCRGVGQELLNIECTMLFGFQAKMLKKSTRVKRSIFLEIGSENKIIVLLLLVFLFKINFFNVKSTHLLVQGKNR